MCFVVLGTTVAFALKLDECQIVKGRRMERISVTLMNEALLRAKQTNINESSPGPSFSVQSEKDIWWLGAIEVPKETNAVLVWIFERTPWISQVICSQMAGERLEVEGYGTFQVEWHLGGDLKTIKCLLGCKQGAMSLYPCPYCVRGYKPGKAQSKKASTLGTSRFPWEDDVAGDVGGIADTDAGREWEASVLRCPMLAEPDRASKDRAWNPIFPFSLSNVHFCTLHAFMRVFDRLLKLHIDYALTMKPIAKSKEAITKVEELLNSIGCHGGNVSIAVAQSPGDAHEVAQQVSMSGQKARHFLKRKKTPVSHRTTSEDAEVPQPTNNPWELWKQLCKATTDNDSNVELTNKRKQVWAHFDKLMHLMGLTKTTEEQRVMEFTKVYTLAWGEGNITHYMVRLQCYSFYWCVVFAKSYT